MKCSVKQARLLAEMTQKQMAAMLGIHVQTYRNIEKKPTKATVLQAQKISEITHIPFDDIFFAS